MKAIFLILKIIENGNSSGEILTIKDFPLDKLNISETQLHIYFKNLYESNYIDGLFIVHHYPIRIKLNNPTLTLKGMEYLEENSIMNKIFKAIKEVKGWLPGL